MCIQIIIIVLIPVTEQSKDTGLLVYSLSLVKQTKIIEIIFDFGSIKFQSILKNYLPWIVFLISLLSILVTISNWMETFSSQHSRICVAFSLLCSIKCFMMFSLSWLSCCNCYVQGNTHPNFCRIWFCEFFVKAYLSYPCSSSKSPFSKGAGNLQFFCFFLTSACMSNTRLRQLEK